MLDDYRSSDLKPARSVNAYTLVGISAIALALLLAFGLAILLFQRSVTGNVGYNPTDSKIQETAEPGEIVGEIQDRSITLVDFGEEQTLRTDAESVAQLLDEMDTDLYLADDVSPPVGSWLEDGETIYINRANQYSVVVNGDILSIKSHYTKIIDVLAEAGIGLVGYDSVRPGPEETLKNGDLIEIIFVQEELLIEEEPIPYQTIWQGSEEMEIDEKAFLSPGFPGKRVIKTLVRFENGDETGRIEEDWVEAEPINETYGYGTRIEVRTMETPHGLIEYWRVVRMRVTAYTPASAGKPPDHPGYGITASGVPAGKGVVAIDPKVVPFRSQVYVPGYGIAFAGDTGGGVKGRWIDLGYNDGEIESWRGYVDVYYLTPVPPPDAINYLIPEQLP